MQDLCNKIRITPTYSASHQPERAQLAHQLGRYQRMVHRDEAASLTFVVGLGGERDDALAHADKSLDHPVERAAVEQLRRALRHVTRAMADGPLAFAFAASAAQLDEMVEIVDADRHLDEMDGHEFLLSSGSART